MNRTSIEEENIKKWLAEVRCLGSNVDFVCDDPPDIKIDEKTAVEVMRLYSKAIIGEKIITKKEKGKSETTIQLKTTTQNNVEHRMRDKVNKAIKEINKQWPKNDQRYFFVQIGNYDSTKPSKLLDTSNEEVLKILYKAIETGYQWLPDPNESEGCCLPANKYSRWNDAILSVTQEYNNINQKSGLSLGIELNSNTSQLLASKYLENIKLCMVEKAGKVSRKIKHFNEWWLVLVDEYFPIGNFPDEQKIVRDSLKIEKPWSRIIILPPDICQLPNSKEVAWELEYKP